MFLFCGPALQPYFRQIIMTLLTRMQQNKTNNYVYNFVYFVLTINADGITPDYIIQTVDEILSGYYSGRFSFTFDALTEPSQAMVTNRVQLRRAANFTVGPQRPQGSCCRPNASPHTKQKHALPKRTQPKNMVRPTSVPRRPLTWILRHW